MSTVGLVQLRTLCDCHKSNQLSNDGFQKTSSAARRLIETRSAPQNHHAEAGVRFSIDPHNPFHKRDLKMTQGVMKNLKGTFTPSL